MPKFNLNDEGQLVNDEGEVFELEGEAVTVEGAKTQADIDKTVNDRLARERQKFDELKKAAETVPNLQKMVDESAAKIRELETEAEQIKTLAEQESSAQINKHRQEAEKYKARAEQSDRELLRFQVKTDILSAAGSRFNDPATDLVPHLTDAHKREPVKGDDGKPTGEFKDFYKVRFKNEQDEEVEDFLPLSKALDAWEQMHPHHVKASGASGSGGGQYGQPNTNVKRSEMNVTQRTDYIEKHGPEAYQALPS